MRNLVEVKKTKPDQLPLTRNTIYKYHSLKMYPDMIFKVAGKIFFDMDRWYEMIEEARQQHINDAKRLHRAVQEAGA